MAETCKVCGADITGGSCAVCELVAAAREQNPTVRPRKFSSYHGCLDMLLALRAPDEKLNYFTKEDGSWATAEEVREYFKEELAKGYKYLAFGGCDNRTPDGRCAGHPVENEEGVKV